MFFFYWFNGSNYIFIKRENENQNEQTKESIHSTGTKRKPNGALKLSNRFEQTNTIGQSQKFQINYFWFRCELIRFWSFFIFEILNRFQISVCQWTDPKLQYAKNVDAIQNDLYNENGNLTVKCLIDVSVFFYSKQTFEKSPISFHSD